MHRLAPVVAAAAAAVVLAACGLFPREEKVLAPPLLTPPEVTYDLVEATKGTIEDKVLASGTFVPVEQTSLSFRYRAGRLRAIAVKLGDTVKAGQLIAELDTGSLQNRIAQQRLVVRRAELVAERTTALGRDRYERELASIDVELAKLELDDLESELEGSRLYSPAAGVVVYLTRAAEGDAVDSFSTVAQVADPKRLQLLYQGDHASDFELGMAVTVSFEGRAYRGEVVQCPGSTPLDVPDDLRDAVVVRLAALPAAAERGDTAQISVILARRDNVVVLPRDVVHQYAGRQFVQVMQDGVKSERTIEVGIETTTEVEVVKGLEPGEQVVAR